MNIESHPPQETPGASAIDRFLLRWFELPTVTDGQTAAFDVFARHFSHWAARTTLVAVTLLVLLFWPTDLLLFRDDPRLLNTFFWWRLGMAVIGVGSYVVGRIAEARGASPIALTVSYYYVLTAHTFYNMGTIDDTAFYLLGGTLIPPLSLALLVPLAQRVGVVLGVSALIFFSYQAPQTGPWGGGYFKEAALILLTSSCVFSIVSGHVMYLLSRKNYVLSQRFKRLANVDPLTGIQNRRSFLEDAARELTRARRYGHPVGVLMLDIDRFKSINDRLGHAAGDKVLRHFARVVASNLRDVDTLGRFGGEEFAAILPETDPAGTLGAAERIRAAVEAADLCDGEASPTVSIGCASLSDADADIRGALERADEALYAAKAAGRNRVLAQGS